jgi:hypothetical protein
MPRLLNRAVTIARHSQTKAATAMRRLSLLYRLRCLLGLLAMLVRRPARPALLPDHDRDRELGIAESTGWPRCLPCAARKLSFVL